MPRDSQPGGSAARIQVGGTHVARSVPPPVPDIFWDHPPLLQALQRQHMGQVIREFRFHPHHGPKPLPQERVAAWIGLTQPQLSRIENGPPIVHLDRLAHLAALFRIPGCRLWFSLPVEGESLTTRLVTDLSKPIGTAASVGMSRHYSIEQKPLPPDSLDSPLEVIQRMQAIAVSAIDQHTLTELEAIVFDAIDDYERFGPATIVSTIVEQRRWLHHSLLDRHPPRIGIRLFTLAARMSGILASLALDLQSFRTARAYASEAFQLAEMVDHPDLSAWVRGTQSLIEYYARRYDTALEYARDGLRIAPAGPQTIRLIVNGEARALARLGDRDGVDAAVDRATQLHEDLPAPPDVSSSLALGTYCAARIHGNAATAYLILHESDRVLVHGEKALKVFDPRQLQGPRALTRLDMATALLQADHPDPPRAAHIVRQALAIEGVTAFGAVTQRTGEFLAVAASFRSIPEISDIQQQVHDLAVPALAASPEEGSHRDGH